MLDFLAGTTAGEILGVISAFIIAFDRLAKLTPTKADNKAVEAAQKIFSVLGAVVKDNPGKR